MRIPSLAFGGGLLAFVLSLVPAQTVGTPTSQTGNRLRETFWPPRPDHIVTVDYWQTHALPPDPIPAGGSVSIYQVPPDKWFVMTGMFMVNQSGVLLVENLGGAVTVKANERFLGRTVTGPPTTYRGLSFAAQQPLGLVFQPGATVAFLNPAPSSIAGVVHAFFGYLVDDALRGGQAWPPHPRDIVNFDSSNTISFGLGLAIPQSGTLPIYSVPAGKELVLTAFWREYSAFPGQVRLCEGVGGTCDLKASEYLLGDGSSWTYALPTTFEPPLGFTFRSGSQVTLHAYSSPVSGLYVGMVGYLVPSE